MSVETHLFLLLSDFALRSGARRIDELPGVWEHQWSHAGRRWFIAMHTKEGTLSTSSGQEIPGHTFAVECDGWPVAMVGPSGWDTVAGSCLNEQVLREAIAEESRQEAFGE